MNFALIWHAIIVGTRARIRLSFFTLMFIFLSGTVILSVMSLETDSNQNLLDQKAIVLTTNSWNSIEYGGPAPSGVSIKDTLENRNVFDEIEEIVIIRYIDLDGSNIRIFGIDSSKPWSTTEGNPKQLVTGSFISGPGEALLSTNFSSEQEIDSDLSYRSYPNVGSEFTLSSGTVEKTLRISGNFKKNSQFARDDQRDWIMIDTKDFDDLIGTNGMNIDNEVDVWVYEVIIIVKGTTVFPGIFEDDAYKNIELVRGKFASASITQTDWQIDSPDIQVRSSERALKEILLMVSIIGGIIMATLYALLISWFRTEEIAIYKAVGYDAAEVRIFLLAEIFTAAFLGFIIAITGIQGWFIYTAISGGTTYFPNVVFSTVTLISFGVSIISQVLGILIISNRTGSVRPITLLQSRGK